MHIAARLLSSLCHLMAVTIARRFRCKPTTRCAFLANWLVSTKSSSGRALFRLGQQYGDQKAYTSRNSVKAFDFSSSRALICTSPLLLAEPAGKFRQSPPSAPQNAVALVDIHRALALSGHPGFKHVRVETVKNIPTPK